MNTTDANRTAQSTGLPDSGARQCAIKHRPEDCWRQGPLGEKRPARSF
jgi:hypothetical protein